MRLVAQEAIVRVFKAEVEELCGVSHHRSNKSRDYYRAGSTPGSVLHEGRKIKLKRPRVRRRKGVDESEEVELRSYLAAREPGELNRMLFRALVGNVPSRRQRQVYPYSPKNSKSSISRLFMREGARISPSSVTETYAGTIGLF